MEFCVVLQYVFVYKETSLSNPKRLCLFSAIQVEKKPKIVCETMEDNSEQSTN